jgi:hypothetical protein
MYLSEQETKTAIPSRMLINTVPAAEDLVVANSAVKS